MDPLSIIFSTMGVAGVVAAAVRKVQEVRGATAALNSLSNEVSDLIVVLQAMEDALKDTINRPSLRIETDLIPVAQSIRSKLQNIEEQITQWTRSSSVKKHSIDPRRMNRLRLSSKANLIKDEVRTMRLQLMTILNAVVVTKSSRIELDLREVYVLAQSSVTEHASVHQKLDETHSEQIRHLEEISTSLAGLGVTGEQNQLPFVNGPTQPALDVNHEVGHTSSNSVRAFHHNGSLLFASKEMTAISAVGIRTAHFSRTACTPWCSCICHKKTTLKTPSFMERLLGSLFIGYSGIPRLRPKCNEHSCHLESQPLLYITYFFPAWFLARTMSLMISTIPLAGPLVSLKMQRAVPGDAEIFVCAKTGNIDKMKSLFRQGLASPNDVALSSGITALHFAISYQHLDICKLLLQANADPFLEDRVQWTAADNAWAKILSGRFSTEKERQLRIMFSDTEHLERWSLTPLHKIVLGLLGRDLESELEVSTAEINTKDSNGRTALSFAAERSDILSMSLLLRYGADPGVYLPDQGSPLHFSATAIDTAGISILLEHGAAVDSLTSYSQTPLLYAAAYGSSRRHAELLLAAGADPNFKDRDGMTPLHWTAVSGNVEVATAILTHGGDADITDGHGDTVLSLSIRYNRHGIISALVSRKPNVTAEFAAGRTLLHIVAEAADLRTMNLLTRFDLSGIDVDTKGADRKTALEVFQDRQDAQEELEYAFGLLLDAEESGSDDGETTSEETWEDAVEFLDFL